MTGYGNIATTKQDGGSTIGLAGCGIWLIFVAIFGMGAESRSGGNFNYERERDFVFLRSRDVRIARGK